MGGAAKAHGAGNRSFASAGYYNLARLELSFYHYGAAMEDTELSNRIAGRILVKKGVQLMPAGHENRVRRVQEFIDAVYRNGVD